MRAVSDGSVAAIVPQNLRTGGQSGNDDFSTHLRNGAPTSNTADKSALKAKGDASAEQADSAKDTSDDSPDKPIDPTQTDGVQWLAAQMLAFKTKEPVQTVQADGSVQTTIKTSIVTLPKSALEQGTADGVPTLDPATGLLVMKPVTGGTTGDKPTTGELPVGPADTPPTTVGAPPVDTPPADKPGTPETPVVLDPGLNDPPVAAVPPDTTVVDPTKDPSVVDPAATDPTLVGQTLPTDPTLPDGGDILPTADDPTADPGTPGVGQSRSAGVGVGAQISMGRASDVSSGSAGGNHGGDFSGGSQKDSSGPDASLTAATSPGASPGVTAPSMQVQLAVPADRQLAPSIGAEIASTAQGMSALERVLQANDQAQASTPVMKVLNIQLSPPDLGNMSMRLSLEGTSLDVHMSADQGRTRSLIERDRHVIADSLAKVGYSLGTLTIDQSSATSNSNMSSAGQSFTSNNGYDGSSGRQPNQSGNFGGTQGQGRQGLGFMDGDGSTAAIPPARVPSGRGVFV